MANSIPAATLEKFTNFGELLRFLRRRAGLTQLELSIAVGYSDAQISRLEQNLRLPDIPTVEARFIPALDIMDNPQAVARLLDLAANVRREDAPGLGLCPYKGLQYFDETDADLFVGREALTTKVTERVFQLAASNQPGQARFLGIVGSSGSGKSSLVRAGLVPALRWDKTSASWPIHVFTPTAHPLESLAMILTKDTDSMIATARLIDDLEGDGRSLNLYCKTQLKLTGATHFLLVVDQFEELFALCRSEEEREAFIENLLVAAYQEDGSVIIVITLRADIYASCAGYPRLRAALAQNQEYIGAMNKEELQRAIEEPARRGQWELEPGLVDLMLYDAGGEPGALPLLSHALLETWQRRRGRMLTLNGYTSSGGVRGAIAETAEAVFADQLNAEEQAIARRIFLRLTEPGNEPAAGDTRRQARIDELILTPEGASATHNVLKSLADARLITISQDSVQVTHEALIREWPTLRGWLEDNRAAVRLHHQLAEAAQDWLSADREPGRLYRGGRLAQAIEWAGVSEEELNAYEREFLDASRARAEQELAERERLRQRELETAQKLAETEKQRAEEQAQSARLLRKRALYLAMAFIVAVSMALAALFFAAQANQAAKTAQQQQRVSFSRELAAASISNLDVDPERSILLAMQAVTETYAIDHTWTAEAENALRRSLQASRLQNTLGDHQNRYWSVAFSPDGKQLAATNADGTMSVWDALTGEPLLVIQTGNMHGHSGVAFSPDGTRLISPAGLGTAKIWDSASGKELLTLNGHSEWVTGVAFSPDGTRVATASEDRMVVVWNAATGVPLHTLVGHTEEVWGLIFSLDGRRLFSASNDGSIKIWDLETGEGQNFVTEDQRLPVTCLALSPDGSRLAAGNLDGNGKVWAIPSGDLLLTLQGHSSAIVDIAFSPDGDRLATASIEGKAKVWNADNGQELFSLNGHTDQVVGVSFSPDCARSPISGTGMCGSRLATASWDGTVKLWNAAFSQELLTLPITATSVNAFSPDRTSLATVSDDGSVILWGISATIHSAAQVDDLQIPAPKEIMNLRSHGGRVNSLTFSPDGRYLAAGSGDFSIKIWDITTGSELNALIGHTAKVQPVAFSPDGTRLAAASINREMKIWRLDTGQVIKTLFTAEINSIAFSPDGTFIAAGMVDGAIKIWDTANYGELQAFSGHTEGIYSISISPDGKRLATASDDGTAKVWDVASGQELLTLTGHIGWVNSVSFSLDGMQIATSGQDGTVRVWDSWTGQVILIFYGEGDPISSAVFSPDGKYLLTTGAEQMRVYDLNIEDLLKLAHKRVTRELTTNECQLFLHLPPGKCPGSSETTASIDGATSVPNLDRIGAAYMNGRACELTDHMGVNDQFFNQQTFDGLQQASDMFGWEIILREPQQGDEIQIFLDELLQSDCDLIVAPTSASFPEIMLEAAKDNPDQKFQIQELGYDEIHDNQWRQGYDISQATFLAGYLAASVTRTGIIGTYGGINYQLVAEFMDGFVLGVDYYNVLHQTKIQVLGWDVKTRDGYFIDNFYDTVDGYRIGMKLMDEGADILLPVAGEAGLGTAKAVKDHGSAYLIGVDSDWAETYPEYADIILTSTEKRVDLSVLSAVKSIQEGTFTGGTHVGTLENGMVGLAPFHNLDQLVPPNVKDELEQITKDIIAGKIKTKP